MTKSLAFLLPLLLAACAGRQALQAEQEPQESAAVDAPAERLIYQLPVTQTGELVAGKPLHMASYLTDGSEHKKLVVLPNQPAAESRPERSALLQSSFYVDYQEPPVQQMADEFLQQRNPELPLWQDLEQFVAGSFVGNNDQSGIDLASQVATRRAGDCTEYAVISTAIARSLGVPAQVVLGAVVVLDGQGETADAFGHAWTELETEDGWILLDAALASLPQNSLYYLADYPVTSEGISYQWDFVSQYTVSGIAKIDLKAAE
ncbi:MAG: transglutaminase-like domain-containing protein [Gammaproteobacteria bacterium]|nr:transglutaminase-like domain-containing protein [Gammaproteobacteria bacterium]